MESEIVNPEDPPAPEETADQPPVTEEVEAPAEPIELPLEAEPPLEAPEGDKHDDLDNDGG